MGRRQGDARGAGRRGRLRPPPAGPKTPTPWCGESGSRPRRSRPIPGSRRRRPIDPDQLTLALEGTASHAYAVSFIVTNIPTHDDSANGETIRDVEAWFRRRTDIEDRIRDAKLGAALRKLPSGDPAVNTVWMWAALLAGNLSVLLQAVTRIDDNGRAHGARLRHQLLCVPARLVQHARGLTLRAATRSSPAAHRARQDPRTRHHGLKPSPSQHDQGPRKQRSRRYRQQQRAHQRGAAAHPRPIRTSPTLTHYLRIRVRRCIRWRPAIEQFVSEFAQQPDDVVDLDEGDESSLANPRRIVTARIQQGSTRRKCSRKP